MSANQVPATGHRIVARMHRSAADIPSEAWPGRAGGRIDESQGYLMFREYVEPGDPVMVIADDGKRPLAGFHGAVTTGQTALFSHPWKLLSGSQFLRLPEAATITSDAALARHAELLSDVLGGAQSDTPAWAALSARLGEVLVLRGFDTSTILMRDGPSEAVMREAATAMLRRLQQSVRDGMAGAIAVPFVHPCDVPLRQALNRSGFRCGILTGITMFDLSRAQSYEEFVASLPKRRRRRYRIEQAAFESSGMRLVTVSLNDHLERLVELEARNAEKYGGSPDRARLAVVRAQMSRLLGPAVRVPVAERDGSIVACGIDLIDGDRYYGLVDGCDNSAPERAMTYPCLSFYDPIKFAIGRGMSQVRLGFEAFEPKLYRGAKLEARETWIWVPAARAMAALGKLLSYLDSRNRLYFDRIIGAGSRQTFSAAYLGPRP